MLDKDASRRGLPPTLRAFGNGDYRIYWLASLLSQMSRWMQMTLLAFLVLELTDSASLVALVGFFAMAPMLFLGLIGGVLADTINRQRLLLSTHAAGFAAVLVMAALLWQDAAVYWHAYLVILVSGAAQSLEMPSRRSLIHDLLGRSGVTNGLALDTVAMSVSGVIGPALAGGLIVLADVAAGYVAVTLFYLVALTLISRLRVEQTRGKASSLGGMVSNIVQGLRYVKGHPSLRALISITVIMNLLMFPYMPMVPVVARDVLGVGPGLMGILQSSAGVGTVIGAVVIATAVNIRHHGRVFMSGSIIALASLLLFSLSRSYLLSAPMLLLTGLGTSMFGTMQAAIVILLAKAEVRGTALGVVSLAIGTMPLGSLIIAGVTSAYGPTFAIGLNAAVGIVGLAAVALLMPALRQRTMPEDARPEPGR